MVKIFIGSSSEGQKAVLALQRLLQQALRDIEIIPWTHAFELGATTIESLERAANSVDFAVLVLTSDDDIVLRSEKGRVPRDNVNFELGLFMGRLGRGRCYIVQENEPALHLPTDLLGITSVRFTRPQKEGSWDTTLMRASGSIVKRVEDLGPRERFASEFVDERLASRAFADRITGCWWERISVAGGEPWLSYFRMEFDAAHNAIRLLEGRGYDSKGEHGSSWDSNVARIWLERGQLDYHWQGSYIHEKPNEQFHGFGSIVFEGVDPGIPRHERAHGRFWDVDEAHPERTTAKPVEMRRALDEEVQTMRSGSRQLKTDLVLKVLKEW